jgi:hypothetical protein
MEYGYALTVWPFEHHLMNIQTNHHLMLLNRHALIVTHALFTLFLPSFLLSYLPQACTSDTLFI